MKFNAMFESRDGTRQIEVEAVGNRDAFSKALAAAGEGERVRGVWPQVPKATLTFTVTIELEHISGPELDTERLADAFAGTIGRQNAAPRPLRIVSGLHVEGNQSEYEVRLVDTPR